MVDFVRCVTLSFFFFLLVSCAREKVYVPVYTDRPVIQLIPKPNLEVSQLKQDSNPSEVANAYVNSLDSDEAYIEYLLDSINSVADIEEDRDLN